MTDTGTVTDRGPDTALGPDVSYYSKEQLPLELCVVKYHDQPPDLSVQVMSTSNTRRELLDTVKEYFFAGVRMVWLIAPEVRSIEVLRAPDESRTLYDDATLDGGDVLPGFRCKVSDLFT